MEKTLEKALSELIETIRTDLEARSTPGDRREARSYAELLPVALIVDQKRISVDLREVPEPIRGRILARPIPLVIPAGPGKNAILDFWQRRCFDEAGYAITVLPLVPIELLTRGRRQRDEVEVKLRDTLALWVWALQPAIERLAASLPEAPTDAAPGLTVLATQAAFFSRYASQSVARRPDSLADEAELAVLTSAVHSAVARLSDEGRKHTLVIVGPDGGRQEWSGATLRKQFIERAEVLLRTTGRTESASQAVALVSQRHAVRCRFQLGALVKGQAQRERSLALAFGYLIEIMARDGHCRTPDPQGLMMRDGAPSPEELGKGGSSFPRSSPPDSQNYSSHFSMLELSS